MRVQLLTRDKAPFKEVNIPEFYVRPDVVIYDDRVFLAQGPESQRKSLVYLEVTATMPF